MAFLAPFAARGLAFVARPAIAAVERVVAPVASNVARTVLEGAGQAAAQVVGQQAVDTLTTTLHGVSSNPVIEAAGSIVSTAAQTSLAVVSMDPVGVVRGSIQQTQNWAHLAGAVTSGLVRPGGTGGEVPPEVVAAPAPAPAVTAGVAVTGGQQTGLIARGSVGAGPGTSDVDAPGVPTTTHADVVANAAAQQRAENAAAVALPITRSVSPTPLPVNTAHDALPVLQAQTPMDATGPAATQGVPQAIPPVAPGLRALEVEPTRVYNQDHTAQLPPATIMPTMQHQVVVASDPPPPPPPGPQGGSGGTGGGNGALLAVGAVTVGGVIIFLWYRQKRA